MDKVVKYIKEYGKKTIFTCSSVYNVLVSVCIILGIGNYEDFYIVMFSPEKKNLNNFYGISRKLDQYNIGNVVINKHTRFHRAVGISNIQNICVMNKVMKELDTKLGEYLLVNCSWNHQKVTYPASLYFKYAYKAVFMEEGATQFMTPDEGKWYILLKKLYGNQTEFWRTGKLDTIFVQEPGRFPKYLHSMLVPFSLRESVTFLNRADLEKLVSIFTGDAEKKEIEYLEENAFIVIFTQPLSEDGYISEKEKIGIYGQIVEFYSKYGDINLKVHPRDTSEYSMENVTVLQGTYPSELLMILGIEFDYAIGLCTSAVETALAKKKINLNEKFLTEFKFNMIPLEGDR